MTYRRHKVLLLSPRTINQVSIFFTGYKTLTIAYIILLISLAVCSIWTDKEISDAQYSVFYFRPYSSPSPLSIHGAFTASGITARFSVWGSYSISV